MHPSRVYVALVTNSSTGDVVSRNGTGVLCSRVWIRMYVARHLEEEVYVMVWSSSQRLCGHDGDQFSLCELTRGKTPAEMNSRLSG